MANDDVLIIGKLEDGDLRKSVNELVDYIDNKTSAMANNFQASMDKMMGAMRDFAITQKVSVDLIKQAWKDMGASFDAMFDAEKRGTGGGKGSGKPTYPDNTVGALEQEIATLKKQRKEMELNSDVLKNQNTLLEERKRLLKEQTTAKPMSFKEVMGMDVKSVDDVAKKMRALKQAQIDPKNAAQVRALGNEYQRLSRLQAEMLGKNIQLTHSNNYLAQSFGYIRNRIVYALTLGAISNFTKQIYEVRGQYELLERSLGILIDDMRKGSEMFNELNQMALKSPFTLMELATGAKQLLAYNFAEEEVVDTTRRLADISAALGVPMERLVYNLGQIKAQTVLTARDARDFANAGLAIVPMLAQMYTEQKRFGDEIVTTAQVFDMMSKKMVTYSDVMQVINKVTDEGGKFFDFQAKQADTLRVKMANLTLAWNNMLNEIGEENQKALTLPVTALKTLFENWSKVYEIVRDVAIMYGIYRARAILVAIVNGTLISQGVIKGMFQLGRAVAFVTSSWKILSAAVASNPIGAIATVLTTTALAYGFLNSNTEQATEYQERFGKAGAKVVQDTESLFDTLKGISKESSNYKKVMGELNSILEEYGIETVKETDSLEAVNDKRRMAIALIKEETLERKHLNDVQQGREEYSSTISDARDKMRAQLKNAMTGSFGFVTENEEIRKNASAIANIISDVVESNISLIAGKTGDEYEKGVNKIYDTIQERMRAIGISESTISKQWLDDTLFLKNDIVGDFIDKIKSAKEEQDRYIESTDKAYEAEKKAIENGASFNDRVEQTHTQLMKAANDTDNFAKKVSQLLKDYGGQNVIDFLVKVKTEVPAWMGQKSLTELTQLAARFAALATNAKKAGKTALNVNGTEFSIEQLFQRAAQYTQAAQNKAADIEARKSSTITREASEALKEYKSSLEAVNVAKNRLKQGTADQALVTEKETAAQKAYNKALEKGVSVEELKKAKDGKGGGGSKKDKLGDALAKEVQLISDMQKLYKEYQKAGVDADSARIATAKEYEKTLKSTNAQLSKFGIKGLSGEQLATMDARALRDYYTQLRDIANMKGNTKGVEALEKAIRTLNVEITKVDYKKITDGLNNELSKLKDEYELAVELDANPELGGMFAQMLGIDTDALPQTFAEALERANKLVMSKLKLNNFDLMSTKISPDNAGLWNGMAYDSDTIQKLVNAQKQWRELYRKNLESTEKMLDDYVKKYGDYSDKMAEIEAKRLAQIKALNDAYYTEEMRKSKEYRANLNAINAGAESEKGQVKWDEFMNSTLYITMFENLEYASTKTLQAIHEKLEELKGDWKQLKPEQLKTITDKYLQIEVQLSKRNPFKGLIKNAKEYAKAVGSSGKKAQENLKKVQEEYDSAENLLASLKSEAKQMEANNMTNNIAYKILLMTIDAQDEKVKKLKQELSAASELVMKYDLMRKIFKEQTSSIAATVNLIANNLQGIAEFRDTLNALFGVDASKGETLLGHNLDGVIDGLAKTGQAMSSIVSSATSGNVFGVVGGVVNVFAGIGDTISSIFGGGSAKTKRLNAEINKSVEIVRKLSLAYKDLEYAVENAMGAAELQARRQEMVNKEAQMRELQRQKQLESEKRSKDRDDDRIKELESAIKDLQIELKEMADEIASTLLGSKVKDAAEAFVNTWVDAWREGEDTMAALDGKFDDMIDNMIMKSVASKIVASRLQRIWDAVDEITSERSEGGAGVTMNELQRIKDLIGDKSIREAIDEDLKALYGVLGIAYGSNADKGLSALQQGIQSVTEDTAGAIEAYMNGVSQQVYLQSDLLTEIRDAVVAMDSEFQMSTLGEILLQLRSSYEMQMAIHAMMEGWTTPSGNGIRVELLS